MALISWTERKSLRNSSFRRPLVQPSQSLFFISTVQLIWRMHTSSPPCPQSFLSNFYYNCDGACRRYPASNCSMCRPISMQEVLNEVGWGWIMAEGCDVYWTDEEEFWLPCAHGRFAWTLRVMAAGISPAPRTPVPHPRGTRLWRVQHVPLSQRTCPSCSRLCCARSQRASSLAKSACPPVH